MDNYFFIVIFVMFFSGMFHGLVGFGFPMLATPALSLFMSIKHAILTTLFPNLFINTTSIVAIKKEISVLKKFWLLGVFVSIGSVIGTKILIMYPYEIYKLILAFFIVIYLQKEKFVFNLHELITKNHYFFMVLTGLMSGIVGGIANVMVSVLIIYILELRLEKNASIVLMNFCFLAGKLTQIIIFYSSGLIGKGDIHNIFYLLLATFFGFIIGKYFNKKISTNFYQKLLRITLWVFAAILTIQYFMS